MAAFVEIVGFCSYEINYPEGANGDQILISCVLFLPNYNAKFLFFKINFFWGERGS